MALTYSPATALDSPLPAFDLKGVDEKNHRDTEFQKTPCLVVAFICNHCPYVRAIERRLIKWAGEVRSQGVRLVTICSNDPAEYPEDDFSQMKVRARELRMDEAGVLYLHDPSQIVAKTFGAVCTPDFFVFDRTRRLKYRGRFDDSWKNEALVQRRDLPEAVQAILKEEKVNPEQIPTMGCSIKWRES